MMAHAPLRLIPNIEKFAFRQSLKDEGTLPLTIFTVDRAAVAVTGGGFDLGTVVLHTTAASSNAIFPLSPT